MFGVLLLVAYVVVLVGVLFVGPGWLFVWEVRKGRTLPPFRVELASQPRRYWLCILAHAGLWVLWDLACVFALLVLVVVPVLESA